jgi:uncharacterized protein YecT (DUF1311 family)
MKRVPIAALSLLFVFAFSAAPATADDAQEVFACVNAKGAALAGQQAPQGCVGVLSSPCIKALEVPADSQMGQCIAEEAAAWDKLMNDAYGEAQQTMTTAQFARLRKTQRAWLAKRDKSCALPEESGTLERLEANSCLLEETSKRVIAIYKLQKIIN